MPLDFSGLNDWTSGHNLALAAEGLKTSTSVFSDHMDTGARYWLEIEGADLYHGPEQDAIYNAMLPSAAHGEAAQALGSMVQTPVDEFATLMVQYEKDRQSVIDLAGWFMSAPPLTEEQQAQARWPGDTSEVKYLAGIGFVSENQIQLKINLTAENYRVAVEDLTGAIQQINVNSHEFARTISGQDSILDGLTGDNKSAVTRFFSGLFGLTVVDKGDPVVKLPGPINGMLGVIKKVVDPVLKYGGAILTYFDKRQDASQYERARDPFATNQQVHDRAVEEAGVRTITGLLPGAVIGFLGGVVAGSFANPGVGTAVGAGVGIVGGMIMDATGASKALPDHAMDAWDWLFHRK